MISPKLHAALPAQNIVCISNQNDDFLNWITDVVVEVFIKKSVRTYVWPL